MSYTDCVSRISSLDSLIRRMDPGWATSGYSMSDIVGLISEDTPFSGILQTVADETASGDGTTGATTNAASALTASSNASVLGSSSASGAGIFSKFNVIGVKPTSSSSGVTFETPLPGGRLTQGFGPTDETLEPSATINGVTYAHYHDGMDLAARQGTSVRAAADGTVIYAGAQSDGCVIVKIQHPNGYVTEYGHLQSDLKVSVGDRVSKGQAIGQVGMTGKTTGPHLHFSLFNADKTALDPQVWIKEGRLPDPNTLLGPNPAARGEVISESAADVLARYDKVKDQIPYGDEIRSAAVGAGIDPFLLVGLVYAESNFHPNAQSKAGASGLTQLMPKTAKGLGVNDIFDPEQNLSGGARYIAKMIRNFGRVDLALAAYNAGPGAIGRLGVVPDSKAGYVRTILRKWSSYQEQAA